MRYFTVKEIAEKLNVNPETVRRWLRNRTLWGHYASKRAGFIVLESELERFLNTTKGIKYNDKLQKEKNNSVIAVTYFRIEAGVTDMRYFRSIEELASWFQSQRCLEPTIITNIKEGL